MNNIKKYMLTGHTPNGTLYYHHDELGSLIRVSSDNWMNEDEFGNSLYPSINKQLFGFTGYELDPILDQLQSPARGYSPKTGRFTSEDTHWNPENMIYGDSDTFSEAPDPLRGIAPDSLAMGQSNNLYGYTMNNPIKNIDLNGKFVLLATQDTFNDWQEGSSTVITEPVRLIPMRETVPAIISSISINLEAGAGIGINLKTKKIKFKAEPLVVDMLNANINTSSGFETSSPTVRSSLGVISTSGYGLGGKWKNKDGNNYGQFGIFGPNFTSAGIGNEANDWIFSIGGSVYFGFGVTWQFNLD